MAMRFPPWEGPLGGTASVTLKGGSSRGCLVQISNNEIGEGRKEGYRGSEVEDGGL
jgi:hypothetical protein